MRNSKLEITTPETAESCGLATFSCTYKGQNLTCTVMYQTEELADENDLKELRIRRVDKWPYAEVMIAAVKALKTELNK